MATTVRDLIKILLEQPMTDRVVIHGDNNTPGHWKSLDPKTHIRNGTGITILELRERE